VSAKQYAVTLTPADWDVVLDALKNESLRDKRTKFDVVLEMPPEKAKELQEALDAVVEQREQLLATMTDQLMRQR